MRTSYQFFQAILAAFLLLAFVADSQAQQQSQQPDTPTLSPAIHTALYPEVMCAHCIVPQWDHGYIVHREFDKDPAVVTMYDRNGKKVLEAHVEPRDFAQAPLMLRQPRRPRDLAVGGGPRTDGSIEGFTSRPIFGPYSAVGK